MRTILATMAGLALLILTPQAGADGYCRSRTVYTYHAPAYVAPAYTAPTYVAPTYDYSPYLKTLLYPFHPDYYSSTSDYYRDQLLVNAVAGKTAELLKGQQELQSLREEVSLLRRQLLLPQQPQQAQPPAQPETPRQTAPIMPKATGQGPPVPDGLQQVVQQSCIRCHGANNASAGGGIDLSNLAAVPVPVRLAAKAAVDDGYMPKGGKALPDQAAALFHLYATGRNGAATAQK